jgi:preprotein translocase subunit SecD
MTRHPYITLVIILLIVAFAGWVDLSKHIYITNPLNSKTLVDRNTDMRLGLDLRGGLQVLLEADLPETSTVSSNDLTTTRQILENRANGLGVSEVACKTRKKWWQCCRKPACSNLWTWATNARLKGQ